jgi:hypothetical protein
VKMESLRIILLLSAAWNLDMTQLDVETAFFCVKKSTRRYT